MSENDNPYGFRGKSDFELNTIVSEGRAAERLLLCRNLWKEGFSEIKTDGFIIWAEEIMDRSIVRNEAGEKVAFDSVRRIFEVNNIVDWDISYLDEEGKLYNMRSFPYSTSVKDFIKKKILEYRERKEKEKKEGKTQYPLDWKKTGVFFIYPEPEKKSC